MSNQASLDILMKSSNWNIGSFIWMAMGKMGVWMGSLFLLFTPNVGVEQF